ncbi:UDP-N-acetylmuramoyl-tripeptide--D-alanyl-D-alanine ligase [Clostridium frigidicarnis]|uniref:UDP-N-acetylmuramoyl-tripeptide--D-alanyl-D-alanine ligase n=1 Tax=Clostridium frigidicarnis TaxID=84698 RepID=A0A1I0WHZ5_9CLOT|nr:UDP-N-acetylmuramoyl-tripeptide--D-alanyl-D-alanine ligase [Clostridium frigidicarnis]SFA88395.1 UDP-N-acetylmuramoyl-tripeptide--D-alanyl-D-alanine ligase [Clostridium frigidicarnis]
MKLAINEILESTNGKIILDGKEYNYESVETDTRKLKENSIFIALKGENFNGNDFILDAIKKGSTICIVSEIKFNKEDIPSGVTIIQVKDTKEALLLLSKAYREKLNIKIIGVTGSTGKTSTKDIIAAFLSDKYKVFKTKGNFNNEIGLPLMIFSLDETYDVAVLEMGMNNLGEIHNLANAAMPDIAVITNVGISHIENLKTRENILKAKMEVTDFFNKDNVLVINVDNDMLNTISKDKYEVVSIGMQENNAQVRGVNIVLEDNSIKFDIEDNGENVGTINLPMIGKHNVLNSLLAYVVGKKLDLKVGDMNKGIENLEATSMRLDIIKKDDFTIIDDCYNASPDSMKAAIDVLNSMNGKRKILILGTMRELGRESENAHRDVAKYAKEKNIDELIAVGEYSNMFKEGFEKNILTFNTTEECSQNIGDLVQKGDIILIKASRGMKFEQIVKKLKEI